MKIALRSCLAILAAAGALAGASSTLAQQAPMTPMAPVAPMAPMSPPPAMAPRMAPMAPAAAPAPMAPMAPAARMAPMAPAAPTHIVCDGMLQDRAACLRERGAAQQAARAGGLSNPDPATLRQNALARCSRQPPEDRSACESRVLGTGQTDVTGSVLGGGVIRTTVTPLPPR